MKTSFQRVDPQTIRTIFEGPGNRGDGARNLVRWVRHQLDEGNVKKEQFSFRDLALALGVMDPYHPESSLRENLAEYGRANANQRAAKLLTESNPGVNTNAFQIITGELINDAVIEGYEDDGSFVSDRLVSMQSVRVRNTRITGITALGGASTVEEGHPYEETGFEEKYVTTKETKNGRILSINEELLYYDQTNEILDRARMLGFWVRQTKERTIVRAVTEADSTNEPVYRPSGTAATLYNTNGSLYNWVGSGNTTTSNSTFQSAVALADYTDLNVVREYRATEVKDDRIDGTSRPISGLNGPDGILLVPEALLSTAMRIVTQTMVQTVPGSTSAATPSELSPRPILLPIRPENVLSSPFIDEQGGQALNDWFYGQFPRQFVWTEVWPVQTFSQGMDSESSFERDVVMRFKVRYYGGVSAKDTIWVTKVDGA